MDVDGDANVSEVHAASIFRVEVRVNPTTSWPLVAPRRMKVVQ
jgi:hypothetical protein